jgi:hypothetical protein
MGTNPSVAKDDTSLAELMSAMNAKLDRVWVVIDPHLVFGDFVFATHLDRGRYIGTLISDRPRWLEEHPGRWRRVEDVQQEAASPAPPAESEIKDGPAPAGPSGPASSRGVRNNGNDEDDTALDALAKECSPAHEPAPSPTRLTEPAANKTPVAEPPNRAKARMSEATGPQTDTTPPVAMRRKAGRTGDRKHKKQKPPAKISKVGPKLSPELMRIVLDSLSERPILSDAARKAGIHRQALAYWRKRSAAGDVGYDVEWRGETWKFHEHCQSAIEEAHDKPLAVAWDIAMGGVVYKNDEHLLALGYKGPAAYLKDENGEPVVETIRNRNGKMIRWLLERLRPNEFGKHRKIDVLRTGSVLVVGGTAKKPENSSATAASIRARKWKAAWSMIRKAKS